MKIIGFNFTKISVERSEKPLKEYKIKQDIDIKEITEEEVLVSDKASLKIKFFFSIDFSEDIGKVEIEGIVVLLPENNELNEILNDWKNKSLKEGFRIPLFNFIMNKCNIKSLELEDLVGLPMHIPFPKLAK